MRYTRKVTADSTAGTIERKITQEERKGKNFLFVCRIFLYVMHSNEIKTGDNLCLKAMPYEYGLFYL